MGDRYAPTDSGATNYNRIFEKLVKNPSDPSLEEMVSYFIYKRSKREWATEFYERNGKKPDDQHLAAYVETYTTSRLEGISKEGSGIVAAFADSVIDEVTPQILRRALKEKSFIRDALVATVGAMFYTVCLIVIFLILKFADIDVYSIAEKVFHTK
jgi:hypothetical protein